MKIMKSLAVRDPNLVNHLTLPLLRARDSSLMVTETVVPFSQLQGYSTLGPRSGLGNQAVSRTVTLNMMTRT